MISTLINFYSSIKIANAKNYKVFILFTLFSNIGKMCASKDVEVDSTMFEYMDLEKAFKQIFEEKKLKMLVCGKTGIGKSTLLNTLIGKEVFVFGGPDEGICDAVTREVTSTRIRVQNIYLELFDSPGLQDGTDNEEKYLEEMYTKCKNVNLVLYCIDMTTTRWTDQEKKAIKLITEKFGLDFWKKSILVLTRANMVKQELGKKIYTTFVERFQAELTKQSVPEDVATDVPAVAAGSESERSLSYVSKRVSESCPQGQYYQDFLVELWLTCFERMSSNSRHNFLKIINFSEKIRVNKDTISPAQKEYIEKLEHRFKEVEESRAKREDELNERIQKLSSENQKLFEQMRQTTQQQYTQLQQPSRPQHVEIQLNVSPGRCSIL